MFCNPPHPVPPPQGGRGRWGSLAVSHHPMQDAMTDKITFELDGKQVEAESGETLWQVAQRHGTTIPHLCWHPAPAYRADGNCRACMVEIEGERVLAASCQRRATAGMKVKSASERAKKSRQMVFELLM